MIFRPSFTLLFLFLTLLSSLSSPSLVVVVVVAQDTPTPTPTTLSTPAASLSPPGPVVTDAPSSSPSPCILGANNIAYEDPSCQANVHGPFTDLGAWFRSEAQPVCRVLCTRYLRVAGYNATIEDSDCRAPCTDNTLIQRYSITFAGTVNEDQALSSGAWGDRVQFANQTLCIPHAVCAKMCNDDKSPGNCIYTGSCTHRICFTHDSNRTIDFSRVTHYGPGSILSLFPTSQPDEDENNNNSSTPASTPSSTAELRPTLNRPSYPDIVRFALDNCSAELSIAAAGSVRAEHRAPSAGAGVPFLLDGADTISSAELDIDGFVQCRIFNVRFFDESFDVIRNATQCTAACRSKEASENYVTDLSDKKRRLCIPQSVCREKCGKVPPGCVYSGSCLSMFCVSGRRSKRPAQFPFFSDDGVFNAAEVNDDYVTGDDYTSTTGMRLQPAFVEAEGGKPEDILKSNITEEWKWSGAQGSCEPSARPNPDDLPVGGASGLVEPTEASE